MSDWENNSDTSPTKKADDSGDEDDWEMGDAPAAAKEDEWGNENGEWQEVDSKDDMTPKSILTPKSTLPDQNKEKLLPEAHIPGQKAINSLKEFQIKNFSDIEKLVEKFVKPKLFPADPRHLRAKKPHSKCMGLAFDAKFALLETGEMDKLLKEFTKILKKKKDDELEEEMNKKKEEAKKDEDEKKKLEEERKKEAEAKGETYVDDEDFFAGLE